MWWWGSSWKVDFSEIGAFQVHFTWNAMQKFDTKSNLALSLEIWKKAVWRLSSKIGEIGKFMPILTATYPYQLPNGH